MFMLSDQNPYRARYRHELPEQNLQRTPPMTPYVCLCYFANFGDALCYVVLCCVVNMYKNVCAHIFCDIGYAVYAAVIIIPIHLTYRCFMYLSCARVHVYLHACVQISNNGIEKEIYCLGRRFYSYHMERDTPTFIRLDETSAEI